MLLAINTESKTALYIQIYQLLKEKIHQQEFKTNEKLPSKRQLAKTNNISENTVTSAYEQLLVEGYIYSIERKGYYVSNIEFHTPINHLEDTVIELEPKCSFIYNFTRSNPDQELFPFAVFTRLYRDVFQRPYNQLIGETDGQGLFPLRKQLQTYLSISRGVPTSPEQIILGPSTEYLLSILFDLFDDQPIIGVENPGYQGFQQLFNRANITFYPIPITTQGLDIELLSRSPVNLMIVTSNHQFPTGNIMPLNQRQALLNWTNESNNRYIIENDYDSEFKYSGIPIPSLKYLDQGNRVIHIGSFTRLLSPGIRLSYMVLPDKLIKIYNKKFSSTSSTLSTFEQWVIHDFIKDGHFSTHLNRSRTFYKRKRDKMIQAILQNDPYAKIFGEKAGLHLLVEPSFIFNGSLFKKQAATSGIKLNLLSDYSYQKNPYEDNKIFLSFSSIPTSKMEKVIKDIFKIAHLNRLK